MCTYFNIENDKMKMTNDDSNNDNSNRNLTYSALPNGNVRNPIPSSLNFKACQFTMC